MRISNKNDSSPAFYETIKIKILMLSLRPLRLCGELLTSLQSILPLTTIQPQRQRQTKRGALPWLAFNFDIAPETSGQNEGAC